MMEAGDTWGLHYLCMYLTHVALGPSWAWSGRCHLHWIAAVSARPQGKWACQYSARDGQLWLHRHLISWHQALSLNHGPVA